MPRTVVPVWAVPLSGFAGALVISLPGLPAEPATVTTTLPRSRADPELLVTVRTKITALPEISPGFLEFTCAVRSELSSAVSFGATVDLVSVSFLVGGLAFWVRRGTVDAVEPELGGLLVTPPPIDPPLVALTVGRLDADPAARDGVAVVPAALEAAELGPAEADVEPEAVGLDAAVLDAVELVPAELGWLVLDWLVLDWLGWPVLAVVVQPTSMTALSATVIRAPPVTVRRVPTRRSVLTLSPCMFRTLVPVSAYPGGRPFGRTARLVTAVSGRRCADGPTEPVGRPVNYGLQVEPVNYGLHTA